MSVASETRIYEDPEEQRMLVKLCHDFVAGAVTPVIEHNRERRDRVPLSEEPVGPLLLSVDDVGLRGLRVPEEFGGTPLGSSSLVRCTEELARGDSGLAMLLAQHWALISILDVAAPKAREAWLTHVMATPGLLLATSRDQLARAAHAEPNGSMPNEPDPTCLRARRTNGGWSVDGVQPDVRGGSHAGLLVLAAHVEEPEGGGALVVLPADTPGLSMTFDHRQIGQDLIAKTDVKLAGVEIEDHHVLRTNEPIREGLRAFVRASLLLEAACALGLSQACYDASVRHLQQRVQGGSLIVTYPALAQLIAEMATLLESIRALTYRASEVTVEQDPSADALLMMARFHAADGVGRISHRTMEVYGGSGVMREMGIEKYYRDAIALRDGMSKDAQRFAITRLLLQAAPKSYGGPDTALDLLTP